MNGESTNLHPMMTRGLRDLIIISIVAIATLLLALVFNVREDLDGLLQKLGASGTDELIIVLVVLSFAFGIFSLRRWRELRADITERKRAEEALRESEVRLKEAQALGRIGNWEFDLDRQTIHWSDQVFALYERDRALGQPTVEEEAAYYSPEQAERLRKYARCAVEQGQASEYDLEAWLPSGKSAHFVATTRPVKDATGRVVRLFGTVQDITERKKVEEALQFTRFSLDNTTDTMVCVNQDARLIDVNDAFCRAVGYSREELLSMTVHDIDPNYSAKIWSEFWEKLKRSGSLTFESCHRRKDGKVFPVEATATFFQYKGEEYHCGFARDITERKRAEKALRESELTLRTVADFTYDWEYWLDENRDIPYMSPSCERISGYSRQEFIADPALLERIVHPDDVDYVKRHDERVFSSVHKHDVDELEFRIIHKNGSVFQICHVCQPIFDDSDKYHGRRISNRDITERKQAEEETQLERNKLQVMVDAIEGGVTIHDREYNIIYQNKFLKDRFGGLGGKCYRVYEGREEVCEGCPVEKAIMDGKSHKVERKVIMPDGKLAYWENIASLIKDAKGEFVAAIELAIDITERKQAEEALCRSEEQYRLITENTLDLICLVDQEGNFAYASPSFSEALGYKPEELIGSDFFPLVHPNDRAAGIRTLPRALFSKNGRTVELRYKHQNGEWRNFESVWSWIFDQGRNPQSAVIVSRDITERKRAESALRESEERYRRLFEESREVIYVTTSEGKLVDINSAGVELFGFSSKEELLPTGVRDLYFNPDDRQTFERCIEQQGFVKDFELVLKRKDGEKLNVLVTADAMRDDIGKTVAYRGIMRDVTEQKLLEKQLIQAQKMESIGMLAGGIAHDFNNILQIIRGYASFLRFGAEKPERTAQSIAAIDQAVRRGADLVRQILTFARKTDVVFGPMSVNLMIEEFVKMLADTFPKTISFSLELAKDVPLILADVTQLHQLLLNLCVNARDAMPDGGTVTISTESIHGASVQKRFPRASEEHYVHIGVSDTGTGMDGTILSQIFEPFFTTKEKERGTGLGLAVVWGIMESHKGFINVESEVGRGTTFHLYFPIPHDFIKSRERGSETQKEMPGGSETILVAEDEEVLLELIVNILEAKGYRVLAGKDGIEAINLYRQHIGQISLIVADLGMPKLGGTEVLQKVREMNAGANVIIASGYLEPHMKSELFKAGARAFIQKPYDPNEILKNIREVLDGKG